LDIAKSALQVQFQQALIALKTARKVVSEIASSLRSSQ
jgi:hypothetical protein